MDEAKIVSDLLGPAPNPPTRSELDPFVAPGALGARDSQGGGPTEPFSAYVGEVMASNPEIEAQRAAVRAYDARLAGERAGYLPTVNANGAIERRRLNIANSTQGDDVFTSKQADIEARVPLFDGARTRNSVQVAKAERNSARATLDATTSDVLIQLITAYADVRRDRRIQEYAQQQYSGIAAELRATERRLSFGEATRTDASQAAARLATSAGGIVSAHEDAAASEASFTSVTGLAPASLPPPPALTPLPAALDEARRIARESNPRLRAATINVEAAEQGIDLAKSGLMPTVEGVAGAQYLSGGVANLFTGRLPNDRSAMYAGFQLRVPIFQGGREYAEIRRAREVRNQRRAQEALAERRVRQDVDTAWIRLTAARETIDTARAAVEANEKAVELVKKEEIGGTRTLLDVLDAENELLASRVSLERAERDEFVAHAAVLAAMGRLNEASFGAASAGGE